MTHKWVKTAIFDLKSGVFEGTFVTAQILPPQLFYKEFITIVIKYIRKIKRGQKCAVNFIRIIVKKEDLE